ncbi:hypothetical protein GCM10011316_37590 [Roseibium aquae]|uniref:Uncharacterized protein n=1 Tax=Roseibium aquae TaxID=1323746 RepID=A0A916TQH4_9HYPH|nr:hypothetical protein [Roseibium aquae]GGB62107.1 hypothetical protein GCM10011316_37590 [Roseibium aquae]
MHYHPAGPEPRTLELEFVKGHIAATMTLIHAMIDQGALDRDRLDAFFEGFIEKLPHSRDTMGLRLVIEQWRQGLRDGEDEVELRRQLFEVISGGRRHN